MVITQTQINDFLDCQAYYKFRHVEHKPSWRSANMIGGSAYHEVVQSCIKKKCKLTADDLLSTARNMFELEESPHYTPEEQSDVLTDLERVGNDKNVKALVSRLSEAKNTAIEFGGDELNIDGILIKGYIDIILDGVPHELKLRWRRMKSAPLDVQMTHYAIYLNNGEFKEVKFRKIQVICLKRSIEIDETESTITPETQRLYFDSVLRPFAIASNSGIFVANPSSWKCGQDNCPFWKLCLGRDEKLSPQQA